MRALIQRVSEASVTIDDKVVGSVGSGLVILLGVARGDNEEDARYIVNKTINLRIFADDEGRFNRSALDVGADLLVISQFTLHADTRRGRRPSFADAAPPEVAEALFNQTLEMFNERDLKVAVGRFQAHMLVSINNDGPVTIMIDSSDKDRPRRG